MTASGDVFEAILRPVAARIDEALSGFLPRADVPPGRLHEAMGYSALAPGKRLRPFVLLASAGAFGLAEDAAMPSACAMECVHAYSLIHDDLPAMDDDDYRRGRPSCHKAFDEATAILAGDALLTLAFELATRVQAERTGASAALASAGELARAAGSLGMVGGQALEFERPAPNASTLLAIHERKTGALFRAAAAMGGLLAGASEAAVARLRDFGRAFGQVYQIADDLQDANQDAGRGTGVLRLTDAAGAGAEAERFVAAAKKNLADLETIGAKIAPLALQLTWLEGRL
ncbi:MAG TPA: polyprenyl synthetase family protein [Bacillota bacterium]